VNSLVAIQCGGYTHSWKSAYVLSTLIIGFLLMAAFGLWEWKGAKYPIVPHEIFVGQQTVGVALLIAMVSGMNFYSMLNFYPLILENVYTDTPYSIGLKSLGIGFATPIGATVINWLLSVFKGYNRELLMFSCILMSEYIHLTKMTLLDDRLIEMFQLPLEVPCPPLVRIPRQEP
jgi:hypothetical protein